MTTAPDLPYAAAIPGQPRPDELASTTVPLTTAPLSLVPALPDTVEDIVDFDDALREASPRLQRFAVRRLLDPHEAEEVVQEALLRAFQHKEMLATEDDLMAWLTVVTGRLVIDRLRVRGRMTPVAELPATSRTGRDTDEVVVARDEARIALDALEAMPSRQAAVLWAREVEGLSYDEISERYALSEPTVRSLLHRARRTLRREYAERGGTLSSMGLLAFAPWLNGLRLAGRLRHAAKKTGVAAAATGAGIAVATIAPLWSSPAPVHTHAAPAQPFVVKAQASHLRMTRQAVTAPATPAQAAAASAGGKTLTPETHTPVRVPVVHHTCTNGGVGLQCAAPAGPTLYLHLGTHDVGLTNDVVPVSCTVLPQTAISSCDPSHRKN